MPRLGPSIWGIHLNTIFKLALTLTFLYSQEALCAVVMVRVLHAPLFSKAHIKSKVVQYVDKGEKVKVHDNDLTGSPLENDYQNYDRDNNTYAKNPVQETPVLFLRTLDKNGQEAFILKDHVKPITEDEREKLTAIKPAGHDPTDYRLAEPLPDKYPLHESEKYRAGILLNFGPSSKESYPYPQKITQEDFHAQKGVDIFYVKKVEFDPYERLFFGGRFTFFLESADLKLANGATSKENNKEIGLGPWISYDFFRASKWKLFLAGGIQAAYSIYSIHQTKTNREDDDRTFTGFKFSPQIGLYSALKEILPKIDLVIKAEGKINLPSSLKTSGNSNYPDQWNTASDEKIARSTHALWLLGIGIQSSY